MSSSKFTDEFKRDAVAQIVDLGYSVREVAERLGDCRTNGRFGEAAPQRSAIARGSAQGRERLVARATLACAQEVSGVVPVSVWLTVMRHFHALGVNHILDLTRRPL